MTDSIDRGCPWKGMRVFEPARAFARAALVWTIAAVAASSYPLRAASVFMKNGYIIQGQVVERNEESIVLGWPNGKVYLARRFIESVVYDPGEEKRLEEDERARREQAVAAEAEEVPVVVSQVNELPSTLDEFVRSFGMLRQSPTGSEGTPAPEAPPAETSVPQPDQPASGADSGEVVVARPDDALGSSFTDPVRGIRFRPPKDWEVRATEKALIVRSPSSEGGFRPSMNLVAFDPGALRALEYVSFLKEENASFLESYEDLYDGEFELAGTTGFQVVGRGTYKGTTAVIRQILVGTDKKAFLISTFTGDGTSENAAFGLLNRSLKTLEILP